MKNQSLCINSAEHPYNCHYINTPLVLKLLESTYTKNLEKSYVYNIEYKFLKLNTNESAKD